MLAEIPRLIFSRRLLQVDAGRDASQYHFMRRHFLVRRKSEWLTLVTAAFSHMSFSHLLFNMFALCSFGPAMVAEIGAARFFALYFGSAVTSNAVHCEMSYNAALGASGAPICF